VGSETFRICNELVDDMVTVTTDEICAAIKDGFTDTRCVLEPAGALAIAGMKRFCQKTNLRDQTFVAIASGANMDFDRLRFVSERADSSETLLSAIIPERQGSFRSLISAVEPRNVTEFSYRFGNDAHASILLGFQARGSQDAHSVQQAMEEQGFEVSDLSANELAKAHTRFLAGGRSPVAHEVLYRFEFPERPGALTNFLDTLNDGSHFGWNVSLFHYRNHGADIGRVLVGLQVPPEQRDDLDAFLAKLGYVFHPESDNPNYHQFLREP